MSQKIQRTDIFLVSFYVFGCMNKRTLPEHKELSINLVCPFACPTPATFLIQKYRNRQTNVITWQHLEIKECVPIQSNRIDCVKASLRLWIESNYKNECSHKNKSPSDLLSELFKFFVTILSNLWGLRSSRFNVTIIFQHSRIMPSPLLW